GRSRRASPFRRITIVRAKSYIHRASGSAANNTSYHASTEPTNTRPFDSSQPNDRGRTSNANLGYANPGTQRNADRRATHVLVRDRIAAVDAELQDGRAPAQADLEDRHHAPRAFATAAAGDESPGHIRDRDRPGSGRRHWPDPAHPVATAAAERDQLPGVQHRRTAITFRRGERRSPADAIAAGLGFGSCDRPVPDRDRGIFTVVRNCVARVERDFEERLRAIAGRRTERR